MRIVVLDGYAMNPGDLSWEGLQALGDVTIYERTPPEQTLERAQGAEIVLTNKVVLDKERIAALPRLRYIGVLATGYNVVDVTAAKDRDIVVTNVPAYSTDSVAQMAFALLLELTQRVGLHNRLVHEGAWCDSPDFAFWAAPLTELSGKTMGIVGLGRIGLAVAACAHAFGMPVIASVRKVRDSYPTWIECVALDELVERSDVISLHCPLTLETEGLMNRERIARMKPTAFLINTSRGPVVDEEALADALNSERIAGAGVDVLHEEPPPPSCPLLGAKNCIITPHIAWATREARQRLLSIATENVRAFIGGEPRNVVSG